MAFLWDVDLRPQRPRLPDLRDLHRAFSAKAVSDMLYAVLSLPNREGGLRMKPQTWRRAVPILISPAPIEPMVPIFSRKQGDFQEKQGGDLSTNGQSLRGIRDLDDFSKSK